MFQLSRFFPLGGWGGPERNQIFVALPCPWTCHHPSSCSGSASGGHSRVRFRSRGLWYSACSLVILSWCKGQFRVSVPLIILTLPFNFHVHAQGTSGSSILSEESWLGSTGDVLLASADSVVLFFSVHLLLLMGSSCFSMAFFFLEYCLPPTLCSRFLDIALCMMLNDNPHFLATSFIFLA